MNGRARNDDRILVTGGTGTLGRQVVSRLRSGDSKLRVLSRQSHENEDDIEFVQGDLGTGEGVGAAVEGASIIVHCAGTSRGDEDKALNLVRAASEAETRQATSNSPPLHRKAEGRPGDSAHNAAAAANRVIASIPCRF